MPDTIPLDAIRERLARDLPGWTHEDGALRRLYLTDGYRGAALAAGAVALLAEAAWHHPDLAISYGRLSVALSSHDADGVTERDFALAARIETTLGWRPSGSDPAHHPLREG